MNWKDVWVEKYRPTNLEDIIISDTLKTFLVKLKDDSHDTGAIPNLLFSGQAGCGKTSLAKIIATDVLDCQYLYINGSEESSIEVVRTKVMGFAQTKSIDGKIKLIILDEADGLSSSTAAGRSSAQQALKNVIEEYSANTRFIFTTNHPDKIIEPIHSRLLHFTFNLELTDCIKQCLKILKAEGIKLPKDQIPAFKELAKKLSPDLRSLIIHLQLASVDGELHIDSIKTHKDYHESILADLFNRRDILDLRKSIINDETVLNLDYHELLQGMFNSLINGATGEDLAKKLKMSFIVNDSIVDHFKVSDKEINFSTCLFRLSQLI